MVNIKKLNAALQLAIESRVDTKAAETQAHVTTKTTETKSHVTTKNTETKNLVTSETDAIDTQLDGMTTVNGQLDTNVQAINDHTDSAIANIKSDVSLMSDTAPVNNINHSGTPESAGIQLTVAYGSEWEEILNRSGSGFITRIQKGYKCEMEVIADGKTYAFAWNSSAGATTVVGPSEQIVTIPYASSIIVRAKDKFNDLSTWQTVNHVMTG
jgi:hypothetical protein